MNAEAAPEAGGLSNVFEQVTLFRAHRHAAPPAAQPWRGVFKQGHNAMWLYLYANGRAAVRVDAPGVHQAGPHLFVGPSSARWATPDNPSGAWQPAVSASTVLLHYAYTSPRSVLDAGRASGCDAAYGAEAAATGDFSKARARAREREREIALTSSYTSQLSSPPPINSPTNPARHLS